MPRRANRRHSSFSDGADSLRGVEIFQVGTHRGKTYSAKDLDDVVANFKKFSSGPEPKLRVPAVLGHEESQEFLERSDLPAAGWPSHVYRQGDKLYADFDEIPPKVGRLLRNKAYRTVSSEVYDDPPEGVPGRGKMLRRIAFLGGDIPQLKDLDEIGELTQHAEERRFARYRRAAFQFREVKPSRTAGAFWVFSEAKPMDRDQIIQALAEHGCDTEALKDASDETLAEMLRVCEAKDQQGDGDEEYDESEELPEPKNDEEKKSFAERAKKMGERAKKWAEKYCSKMDDTAAADMPTADSQSYADGRWDDGTGANNRKEENAMFGRMRRRGSQRPRGATHAKEDHRHPPVQRGTRPGHRRRGGWQGGGQGPGVAGQGQARSVREVHGDADRWPEEGRGRVLL